MPRETPSTWWLARPIRCIPLATDVGVSIWTTRSTAPMSIPSSSEDVATRAGRRPALSASSISQALVAGDRAVVGAGDLLSGQLVEGGGQALGQAAGVHEEDRGAVRAHELEETRVDGGPDRAAPAGRWPGPRGSRRPRLDGFPEAGHVLDRHLDPQVEGLLRAGVDDRHRPRLPLAQALAAAEVAGHLLERPLGRREADPLERPAGDLLEPLEGQGEVRSPLRPHERVDLVHDHRVDRLQERPRPRGEDEEERLRRRDEDVGRAPEHPRALLGRGVAGADGHLGEVHRLAAAAGHPGDAGDRRPQVALDVHGEGLERRDVDDAAALELPGDRREHQAVDRGQERRERLARARRREDERALPLRDRGPAEPLRLRGRGEGVGEPLLDRGLERWLRRAGAHRLIIEELLSRSVGRTILSA